MPDVVEFDPTTVLGVAKDLLKQLNKLSNPGSGSGKVARYLKGDHDLPYMPKGARGEYKDLARKSVTNWLPLISDTYVKGLFVDGYRASKAHNDAKPWAYWQANGLDARQTIAHRGALEYGTAYVMVLPGDNAPAIEPLRPLSTVAVYEDAEGDWPKYAMRIKGTAADGSKLYELLDDMDVHSFVLAKGKGKVAELTYVTSDRHGLGVCPIVRFRDRLGDEATGIIEPLIVLQDRINEAVFCLLIALQYASFRQRWATGLAIPVDENPWVDAEGVPTLNETDTDGNANRANPNFGKPIEAFSAAVDRVWVSDSPDAKFGDFGQTDVTGHLETYGSGVRSLAAIAQLSPHVLLGDLVNLSADALAAAEAATQRKIGEYETTFGESWEQVFRLAALAAGDTKSAADTASQVRWRDTEARSLAAAVDALGKMVQMLGVPAEAAWERIPGVTQKDIERWKTMASADGMAALAAVLGRQQTPTQPVTA